MTVRQRYEGLQTICKELNESGCLFLSVLSIAEEATGKEIDLINAIRISQSKGWLSYDFEVKDSLAILRHFTHHEWTRSEKLKKLPATIKDNEYTVAIYYNKNTSFTHFRRRGFDTLTNSVTVRDGVIIGYYIFTERI